MDYKHSGDEVSSPSRLVFNDLDEDDSEVSDSEAEDSEGQSPDDAGGGDPPYGSDVGRRLSFASAAPDVSPEVEAAPAPTPERPLPIGPAAFQRGPNMLVPQGKPLEAAVAKVLQTIADPETVWKQEHSAVGFDAAPGDDLDRALVATVEQQVRAMGPAELDALARGLEHVDCFRCTIDPHATDADRLKLGRAQQLNLLISDVVHSELGGKRIAGMRADEAEALAQKARGGLMRRKGEQEPSSPKLKGKQRTKGSGTAAAPAGKHPGASASLRSDEQTAIQTQAMLRTNEQTATKANAMRERAQANVRASLGLMSKPLGVTQARDAVPMTKVQRLKRWMTRGHQTDLATGEVLGRTADKARPGRNRVNGALDVLFHAVPLPNSSGRFKTVLLWESRPVPLHANEPYVNSFRAHISRTLLRMDTHQLLAVLDNLKNADDEHKNDFRVGILRQAVNDQLTYRGHGVARQAQDLVSEVLDTLSTPAERSDVTQAGEKCQTMMQRLSDLARAHSLPAETYNSLVLDTLAGMAEKPEYSEALIALVGHMSDPQLFAIADAKSTQVVKTTSHKWFAALAASRRQDTQERRDCVGALDAHFKVLNSDGGMGEASFVISLDRIRRTYQRVLASGVTLDPEDPLVMKLQDLNESLQSIHDDFFRGMEDDELRKVLSFFATTGFDAPESFTQVINHRLKVGPFIDAARALAQSMAPEALTVGHGAFVRALGLAGERHADMRTMGVQVTHHDSAAPMVSHASLALMDAARLLPKVPLKTFSQMNRRDLRVVQAAFAELNMDPGAAINAVIVRRLNPLTTPEPSEEQVQASTGRFVVPEAPLDHDDAVVPAPNAKVALASTEQFLARVSRMAASSRRDLSASVSLQFDELIEGIAFDVASDLPETYQGSAVTPEEVDAVRQVARQAAPALIVDALATRAQNAGGRAQVKTLLQHLTQDQLGAIGGSKPSGHIQLSAHAELIELVNEVWKERSNAANADFDTAITQLIASKPSDDSAVLARVLAAHAALVAWDMPPRPAATTSLAAALKRRESQISQLKAADMLALKNLSGDRDVDLLVQSVSMKRADALIAPHARLWVDGLARLKAGSLEDGVRVLRRAMGMAREFNELQHLGSGQAVSERSTNDLHDALMRTMIGGLSPAQREDFAQVIDQAPIRELISVLEAPSMMNHSGLTSEQVIQRKALSEDLKRFGRAGAKFEPVGASISILEAVETAYTSDAPGSLGPVAVGSDSTPEQVQQVAAASSPAPELVTFQADLQQFDRAVAQFIASKSPSPDRDTALSALLAQYASLKALGLEPNPESVAQLDASISNMGRINLPLDQLAELRSIGSGATKALQIEVGMRQLSMRTAHVQQWRRALAQLAKGELQHGLQLLKRAVALGDQLVELQEAHDGRARGTTSQAQRQEHVTRMHLDRQDGEQFGIALNRTDIREAVAAMKVIAADQLAEVNPVLCALLKQITADLESIRQVLTPAPAPFDSMTVSLEVNLAVREVFSGELDARGKRMVVKALEAHSPIRARPRPGLPA